MVHEMAGASCLFLAFNVFKRVKFNHQSEVINKVQFQWTLLSLKNMRNDQMRVIKYQNTYFSCRRLFFLSVSNLPRNYVMKFFPMI